MFYKVLRFFGAIIVALLFARLVDAFHITFFGGAAHFIANLSWGSWLGFDILRGFLLPVAWAILWFIGMGLAALVRGSKAMAALPLVIFALGVISDFIDLFLVPVKSIVADIGQGFWYYSGAIGTFILIVVCYGICAAFMLASDENLK